MSVKYIHLAWENSPYKGERLLALLALADWANDNGECWPSYEQIADKARITERGAVGIIEKLLADHSIRLVERGGGRGSRNRYQLLPKNWHRKTMNEVHPLSAKETLNETARNPERDSVNSKENPEPDDKETLNEKTEKGEPDSKNDETYKELTVNKPSEDKPSERERARTVSAVEIFESAFGFKISIFQQEQLAVITDLSAWKITLHEWKLNGYSDRNLAGMLRAYRENLIRSASQKGNTSVGASTIPASNGKNGHHPPRPILAAQGPSANDPALAFLWERVLAELANVIAPESLATWFRPMAIVSHADGQLTLLAPDPLFEDWVVNNYRDEMDAALAAAGLDAQEVRFVVSQIAAEEAA